MQVIQRYIVNNDYYKRNQRQSDSRDVTFQRRGPLGLMLHSVGCAQPKAEVFAKNWNVPNKDIAVHAVLQADGVVYQCLPWNYRGIHCGSPGNNTHIGVEMTEPAQIRYTSGANFTYSDLAAARSHVSGCYKTAVDLFAMLCQMYKLDPMTDICSHAEGYKMGIATGHGDPEHLWRGLGLSYTMDGFRRDVANKIEQKNKPKEEKQMTEAEVNELLAKRAEKIYNEEEQLPNWAKEPIHKLIEKGYLQGTGKGLDISHSLLRALVVQYRVLHENGLI